MHAPNDFTIPSEELAAFRYFFMWESLYNRKLTEVAPTMTAGGHYVPYSPRSLRATLVDAQLLPLLTSNLGHVYFLEGWLYVTSHLLAEGYRLVEARGFVDTPTRDNGLTTTTTWGKVMAEAVHRESTQYPNGILRTDWGEQVGRNIWPHCF